MNLSITCITALDAPSDDHHRVTGRPEGEFNVPTIIEQLPYQLARATDQTGERALQGQYGVEVLTRVRDGARLALFPNPWRLNMIKTDRPDLTLEPLLADTT